jgi:hypothetical protein
MLSLRIHLTFERRWLNQPISYAEGMAVDKNVFLTKAEILKTIDPCDRNHFFVLVKSFGAPLV